MDIWSCGCILLELVMGERAFDTRGPEIPPLITCIFASLGTSPDTSRVDSIWNDSDVRRRCERAQRAADLDVSKRMGETFRATCWDVMPPGMTHFVKRLLNFEPSMRATAAEALEDPWLAPAGCASATEIAEACVIILTRRVDPLGFYDHLAALNLDLEIAVNECTSEVFSEFKWVNAEVRRNKEMYEPGPASGSWLRDAAMVRAEERFALAVDACVRRGDRAALEASASSLRSAADHGARGYLRHGGLPETLERKAQNIAAVKMRVREILAASSGHGSDTTALEPSRKRDRGDGEGAGREPVHNRRQEERQGRQGLQGRQGRHERQERQQVQRRDHQQANGGGGKEDTGRRGEETRAGAGGRREGDDVSKQQRPPARL